MPSNNSQALVIAIICFIAGIYSILTGIYALKGIIIKIPGFYQLGIFVSNMLYGKAKTANYEKEMMEPKKAKRYGIFGIIIGLVALADGIFLLFVK